MKMRTAIAIFPVFACALGGQTLITIPDVELTNQRGERVHFYSDLVKNKAVAIQTIFTTCTTICPPLGSRWSRLQSLMSNRDASRFNLISITVDPITDTPERLREWSDRFHAGPGWTLLTGSKPNVDSLLKALHLYTSEKQSHKPLALVGSESGWQYLDALATPLAGIADALSKSMAESADQKYFTDVTLLDQNGAEVRLYSDVLKGRTVIINTFFASCTDSCPMMAAKFAGLQEWLGDRLGKDVFLVSISVDPVNDTPAKLLAYAERFKARPGWIFLSGKKDNVDFALNKLGQKVVQREDHTTVFLLGNMRTHLWKKAKGTASINDLLPVLRSVIDDRG